MSIRGITLIIYKLLAFLDAWKMSTSVHVFS